MAREIALLTNPSSGKGRGSRTAAIALPRLKEAGFAVRSLVGRDADEALELAQRGVADGVESLVVVGGDGMVHLAVQALAGTETSLGIIPAGTGNDVARYLDIPRNDPQAAADVVVGSRTRRIDLARAGRARTSSPCWPPASTPRSTSGPTRCAGRAGRCATTSPPWPSCGSSSRCPTPSSSTARCGRLEAMLVAVGNGPSFGGGLRITHGASLDDGCSTWWSSSR